MKKINYVDFETEAIEKRPVYPPKPVGVALEINGKPKYLAWGHPTENNCTKAEAKKILRKVFKENICVFHNAAFDIEVAVKHLGLKPPKDFEDTLFLAYLSDPRDTSLALKPLAEKYLGMPPDEQEELQEWILENVFKKNKKKPTKKDPLGAHIAEAPGKLAGRYAIGDIVRTKKLFNLYRIDIKDRGMVDAYTREKLCMPIFEEMSEVGVKVSVAKLRKDSKVWIKENEIRGKWICKRLKVKSLEVIDSSKQLAEALDKAGKILHWILTEKGNRSTARDNLMKVCTDKKLIEQLGKYSKMKTFISTFALPWLKTASEHGGRVYPSFNQVRSTDDAGKGRGTRTGRPSSFNPNFLNVPRNQEDPDLPNMRDYIIPDEDSSFVLRDYSQQELRILAHYEEGKLYQAYKDDVTMDAHDLVGKLITEATGHEYKRKDVKIVNFGVVYGMGVPGIAMKTESSAEEARELKKAHGLALPGVKELAKEITKHCKKGNPITTWGGREYYVEEPKIIKGQKRDFYYKLLNYLVQGSAADCTKEAMIRADKGLKKIGGRLVLQVYDEILACVPKGMEKEGHRILKQAMESVEFDVYMLSDGKTGKKSWGSAVKYKDPK